MIVSFSLNPNNIIYMLCTLFFLGIFLSDVQCVMWEQRLDAAEDADDQCHDGDDGHCGPLSFQFNEDRRCVDDNIETCTQYFDCISMDEVLEVISTKWNYNSNFTSLPGDSLFVDARNFYVHGAFGPSFANISYYKTFKSDPICNSDTIELIEIIRLGTCRVLFHHEEIGIDFETFVYGRVFLGCYEMSFFQLFNRVDYYNPGVYLTLWVMGTLVSTLTLLVCICCVYFRYLCIPRPKDEFSMRALEKAIEIVEEDKEGEEKNKPKKMIQEDDPNPITEEEEEDVIDGDQELVQMETSQNKLKIYDDDSTETITDSTDSSELNEDEHQPEPTEQQIENINITTEPPSPLSSKNELEHDTESTEPSISSTEPTKVIQVKRYNFCSQLTKLFSNQEYHTDPTKNPTNEKTLEELMEMKGKYSLCSYLFNIIKTLFLIASMEIKNGYPIVLTLVFVGQMGVTVEQPLFIYYSSYNSFMITVAVTFVVIVMSLDLLFVIFFWIGFYITSPFVSCIILSTYYEWVGYRFYHTAIHASLVFLSFLRFVVEVSFAGTSPLSFSSFREFWDFANAFMFPNVLLFYSIWRILAYNGIGSKNLVRKMTTGMKFSHRQKFPRVQLSLFNLITSSPTSIVTDVMLMIKILESTKRKAEELRNSVSFRHLDWRMMQLLSDLDVEILTSILFEYEKGQRGLDELHENVFSFFRDDQNTEIAFPSTKDEIRSFIRKRNYSKRRFYNVFYYYPPCTFRWVANCCLGCCCRCFLPFLPY